MNNFDFTNNTSGTYNNTLPAYQTPPQPQQKTAYPFNLHLDAASLKPVKNYIADAIGEGLKHNLLGNDINMEFLMLSIRSYSAILMHTLAHTCDHKKS